MARYIDLQDGQRRLGRAEFPPRLPRSNGGHFEVRRVVRAGGNGVVFEAHGYSPARAFERTCAIKVLRRQDNARLDRFDNEARVLREISGHGAIAPFYDTGRVALRTESGDFDVPWIAMELGGHNLREHVLAKGGLPPAAVLDVGTQMADAVGHVHALGFIHRDIKPANFVWRAHEVGPILMIDFGIAKRSNEDVSARPLDSFTRQGEFVGPVFFSSPELIAYADDQTHPVDHRSDLFQMGKVLWYLATGKTSAGIPSKRDCPLGGKLHALVVDLIADDPDDRPVTANEVLVRITALRAPR